MKRLIADIHMHTLASGHAYGTIREMAAAAKEQQLQLIGISEHAPGIPGTVDPFYYGNLRVIPRVIDGVEILHGCEINVLNGGRLSLEQKYIDRLDYAIVGIHGLCYQNEGTDGNTTNLIECMKNPKVKLVSHPDDDHTPLDYPRLVQAALQYHVALEVNNSSLVKRTSGSTATRTTAPCWPCASNTGCLLLWTRTRTTPAGWAGRTWPVRCWRAWALTKSWS